MTARERQSAPPHSLALELLEEHFSERSLARLGGADGVTLGRWEAALLGPARDLLSRPGRKFRGRLVELAWGLCGRADTPPPELALLVELIHAGSLVIDDVQDGSPTRRGAQALHVAYGVPCAINTGGWLLFWPHELVTRLELPGQVELELRRAMARAQLLAHQGQALDLSLCTSRLPQAEIMPAAGAIARLKTASLTELAATIGAIAARAEPAAIEALAMFGRELGLALQQLDDVGAVLSPRMRAKGDEDIRHDRVTFAWGYAAEHLDAAAFEQLQVALRELRHPSLAQTDRVIDALRSVAEPGARKLVRARLDAAHERLVDRLGPSPAVLRIAAEIEQLEHGYD